LLNSSIYELFGHRYIPFHITVVAELSLLSYGRDLVVNVQRTGYTISCRRICL